MHRQGRRGVTWDDRFHAPGPTSYAQVSLHDPFNVLTTQNPLDDLVERAFDPVTPL